MIMEWHGAREGKAKKESLGKQLIEGVEAEGTRSTVTIAAGEIGNERAIEIVSERWYSPELQTVVMTRHSDPRFGETTTADNYQPYRADRSFLSCLRVTLERGNYEAARSQRETVSEITLRYHRAGCS